MDFQLYYNIQYWQELKEMGHSHMLLRWELKLTNFLEDNQAIH